MTKTKNKLLAYLLAFVMAFTAFGLLGTAGVFAAESTPAVTVTMWYGAPGVTAMPKLADKDGAVLGEKTVKTLSLAQLLTEMKSTEWMPYFFSGKGKLTVIRAQGVLVSDLLEEAGVDPENLIDLKTAQMVTVDPGKEFMPNDGQKKYLTGGVTFTGATSANVTEETASVDVPFIIATHRYEASNEVNDENNVEKVFKNMLASNEKDGLRSCMGSIGTGDLAGNKFIGGVDSIVCFKTATEDDVTAKVGTYDKKYDGKAKTPEVIVALGDTILKKDTDYTVEYKNNINAGTATANVRLKLIEGSKAVNFDIAKGDQKMTVKAKKKTVSEKKLEKKARTVSAIKVKEAKGTVKYKKVSGSKKLSVNAKTGKIKIKKNTKAGKYKVKVKVTAAGDKNFNAAAKKVQVIIIIR